MKALKRTLFSLTCGIISISGFAQSGHTNLGDYSGTSGNYSTYIGYRTGTDQTGGYNTAIGSYSFNKAGTSNYNSGLGYQAGYLTTTGTGNTFSGFRSGYLNASGSYNSFMGYQAGYDSKGSYNVCIGAYSGDDLGTASYKFVVENNSNKKLLYGDFSTGKLRVGTTDLTDNYLFAVKGNVGVDGTLDAEAINVQWLDLADYVFADDYKLRSLNEVSEFISENNHLPGVPSANEVAENGMNVAEFQNILLEKVEELTLYMIELKKENEALKAQVSEIVK